jgi:hypothetical protein
MFRSIKTIVIITGIITLAITALGLKSYLKTAATYAKDTIDNNLSVDFQIKRAKTILGDLEPEIRKNQTLVVNAELGYEKTATQIKTMETKQATEKAKILRVKTDLAANKPVIYNTITYIPEQLAFDLEARFQRYKLVDSTITEMKKYQATRNTNLLTAQTALQSLINKRELLSTEIQNLEARYAMISALEASRPELQLSDSEMSRLTELIDSIKTRMIVSEKMLSISTDAGIQIPAENAEGVTNQVDNYFGENKVAQQ